MSRHSLAKCPALFAKILNREGNITSGLIHEFNWHPGKSGNGLVASPPPCAVNLYLRVMLAEGLQSISARIDWLVAFQIVCSWNPVTFQWLFFMWRELLKAHFQSLLKLLIKTSLRQLIRTFSPVAAYCTSTQARSTSGTQPRILGEV